MKAALQKPALSLSLLALLAMVAAGVSACADKKYPGELSPVIFARQRAFGFMFQLESPGGAMSDEQLRAYVDSIKADLQDFYKPRELDEFSVESVGGVIEIEDVAYQAAMEGYDEVFMFEGDVTGDTFEGRLRVVNAAGGGAIVDEEISVTRSEVQIEVPEQETTRPASSIAEATWETLEDIFSEKYQDPYQWQMLGVHKGKHRKMEGVEALAEHFIEKADIRNVAEFQKLNRAEMDRVYPYLNYAKNLYQKIRDGYVSGKIPSTTSKDVVRIQKTSSMAKALSDITGFYEDEIDVSAEDFKVTFDFPEINETFQNYFRDALAKSSLTAGIRKYTVKPAEIAVTYDPTNEVGTIFLKVRYSNHRYTAWLGTKEKMLTIENTRTLPLQYFNLLMAEFVKYHRTVVKVASDFDRKALSRFTLVIELQRKLLGYTQFQVSVFENELRPVTSLKIKLCDYPLTEVPTSKPNFTTQTGLYALGTPQNVAGQRLPYASVYEFFELDRFFEVTYPKACDLGQATEIYIDRGGKGIKEKVTIP